MVPARPVLNMGSLKRAGYALVLLQPLLQWGAWRLGRIAGMPNLFAFFPIFIIFAVFPALDYMLGIDRWNPTAQDEASRAAAPYFRLVTLLCVPVQIAFVLWCGLIVASHPGLGPIGQVGWTVSAGVIGANLAITVAHELVHRDARIERAAAAILLSTVCFGVFAVSHNRRHHVHVATPDDPSSAARGVSAYRFVPRAHWLNFIGAWRQELDTLARRGQSRWGWRNQLLWSYGLSLALAIAFLAAFGGVGLAFFLGQALTAFTMLELTNYVQHYGLRRCVGADGRYERVERRHSWDAPFLLSNLVLLELPRHADHHLQPARRYQVLRYHDDSPQHPASYPAMIALALVPPLWRRIVDPRLPPGN